MNKRLFIILSVFFAILCISTITLAAANTAASNVIDGAINGGQRLMQDGANGLNSATNSINNGFNTINNGIQSTTDNIGANENGITNNMGRTGTTTVPGTYTTGRTATELTGTTATNPNTMITWVILAISAVVIGALIWYYVAQDTGRNTH